MVRNITPAKTRDLTKNIGITQLDVIVRNGLIAALKDMRDNPWEVEIALASLLDDPMTADIYGQKMVDKGINYFLSTNLPVILDTTMSGSPAMPVIIVGIADSQEAEATIGDGHYDFEKSIEADYEPLTRSFTGSYDPSTGLLTPIEQVTAHPKMTLCDSVGNKYPILGTVTQGSGPDKIRIAKGLVADFTKCQLVWSDGKIKAQLRSLRFRENVSIQLATKGGPEPLLLLWPVLLYAVLKSKAEYLQARGFERSTISYSAVELNQELGGVGGENIMVRTLNLVGYVQHVWIHSFPGKITNTQLKISGPDEVNEPSPEEESALFLGQGF